MDAKVRDYRTGSLKGLKAKVEEAAEAHKAELHECHMAYQETLRKCYENR